MTGSDRPVPEIELSQQHRQAVDRQRRVVVNYDVGYPANLFGMDVDEWVKFRFAFADEAGSHIDSLWWCLDEGNLASYPSQVIPEAEGAQVRKWLDAGVDILKIAMDACHERSLEAFYSYRVNGFDMEWTADGRVDRSRKLTITKEHPDWMIPSGWGPGQLFNFAVEGVRDYKLAIIREMAERYDLDGIDLFFARHPPSLPPGHQWEHRDDMTDFVRRVRRMLQEIAERRGRPFLLSASVPATIPGCHFDGFDVETWARENLVDLFVIGVHSFEVDLAGFSRMVGGRNIKLYPCMDDHHHPPGGYDSPPIEIARGYVTNWWHQGADGICTFNWANAPLAACEAIGFPERPNAHQQAYREIGNPDMLRSKDKTFALTRRFGGGWSEWTGSSKWDFYHNMNIEAQLPAPLLNDQLPTILTIYIADHLPGDRDWVARTELWVEVNGAEGEDRIQAKLNGVLLPEPRVADGGWRIFSAEPRHFAVGSNLVYLVLDERANGSVEAVTIEKLEVHVAYGKSAAASSSCVREP